MKIQAVQHKKLQVSNNNRCPTKMF